MTAVHVHGLIHHDLKPQNVLLGDHGEPWVTDFGLSSSHLSGSLSKTATSRGTLAYKAPELFRSRKHGGAHVSPALDVYAFGVLAFEALTRVEAWAELESPVIRGGWGVGFSFSPMAGT
ncbi:hypothetical protein AB1Y20_009534 [Prymnesium parvum]|uniref:Protein kinase domain-containing protein n=1 Tax=Prymnesium parvum TaxID=97485 RepID=A0AB34K4H5_PRYPA